jgi:hypothetical protein
MPFTLPGVGASAASWIADRSFRRDDLSELDRDRDRTDDAAMRRFG